ncbi:DUF4258 domain-containing protein [Brevibacillus borstelensis]|uniref:DUF4258 domain-containing protein n=1 Tax=Brevibacillus borstelensis TaxID=45462 RepID=UPI00203AFD2E|nr:DUF4258 domain-containing protein [Brevibacillus borstelensis]MCM3472195.1 DUF4258 domain-containing protein [Brevibacillus borstelensis]
MKVRFTKHALKRCDEQGIDYKWVRSQLRKMPNFYGEYQWSLKNGHQAVVLKDYSSILVITVIGAKKRKQGKKTRRGLLPLDPKEQGCLRESEERDMAKE